MCITLVSRASDHILIILHRIEELSSHIHLLLLIILRSIRSLPLVDQIHQMCLIISSNSISSPNSIISYTTCINTK